MATSFNFKKVSESPAAQSANETMIKAFAPEPNESEEQAPQQAPQSIEQSPAPVPAPPPAQAIIQPEPIPYHEVLKNVGAKIPYSIYDRLERIKRQSERSGIRSEKRNIGDLIAQAIKEFVERNDVIQVK